MNRSERFNIRDPETPPGSVGGGYKADKGGLTGPREPAVVKRFPTFDVGADARPLTLLDVRRALHDDLA